MFWKLPKEIESDASLICKFSPVSSYDCLGLRVMPELVVVFNQLRDLIPAEESVDLQKLCLVANACNSGLLQS